MATYSSPVNKQWLFASLDDFTAGTNGGTELENPNYVDKVVLECKLGENLHFALDILRVVGNTYVVKGVA